MARNNFPLNAAHWPFCRLAPVEPRVDKSDFKARELRAASEAVARKTFALKLYPLALVTTVDQFEPAMFELLRQSVDFDSGWTGRLSASLDNPVLHNSCLYGLPIEWVLDWERLKSEPALKYFRSGAGRTLIVSKTGQEISAPFRNFLEKYGLWNGLLSIAEDPVLRLNSFLSLYRRDDQRAFSQDERDFMEVALPHIVSATNINRVYHIAQIKSGNSDPHHAVGICDNYGILQYADAAFANVMLTQWPSWSGPSMPPEILLGKSKNTGKVFLGSKVIVEVSQVEELLMVQVRPRSVVANLSTRELDVARLFASAHSYKEVAQKLQISPTTVKSHLKSIYRKLEVRDKGSLAHLLGKARL